MEAIEKIRTEMEQNSDNAYVQIVGDFLLQHLNNNPAAAGQILAQGKSIQGSLEAMRKVAEGKKKGNVAVLTPEEGYAAVLKYFGLEDKPSATPPRSTAPKVGFDVDLDDLLPRD